MAFFSDLQYKKHVFYMVWAFPFPTQTTGPTGGTDIAAEMRRIEAEMKRCAADMEFERAAALRDRLRELQTRKVAPGAPPAPRGVRQSNGQRLAHRLVPCRAHPERDGRRCAAAAAGEAKGRPGAAVPDGATGYAPKRCRGRRTHQCVDK